MEKVLIHCDNCGKDMLRYPSKIHPHNYCSRGCLGEAIHKKEVGIDYTKMGEHLSRYNREHNPTAMTPDRRAKLREARLGTGEGKTYTKIFGRHAHVVVAEQMLGRKLLPGEIVHHIDRNKRNNDPSNLVVMTQSEHAKLHAKCRNQKEVMSDEFQTVAVSAACRAVGA